MVRGAARGGRSKSRGASPSTDDEAARLRRRVAELEIENEKLRNENSQLQEKLKAVSREAFRQAAPFRRREPLRSKAPKKPGRRPGHPGSRRPVPKQIDERVETPLSRCPHCGGRVTDVRPIKQTVEDIPAVRAVVTQIVTYRGTCADCGPVRSTHPRQVSLASGAAGVQVGPRAAALATDLNKRLGIPAAKTCAVLNEHFSLKLTPGGLVHLQARLARRLTPTYDELAVLIRKSPVVHADETSWWVGGPGHWLWVFTNPKLTFYLVDPSRGRDVVVRLVGPSHTTECNEENPAKTALRRLLCGPKAVCSSYAHNAGIMQTRTTKNALGWDMSFATNHLGPFALTEALVPHLPDGANVVFVVSAVEDPQRKPAVAAGFRGSRYLSAEASARGEWKPGGSKKPGFDAYATSKQAVLAAAMAFARETPRLHFNAVEPGLNPTTGLGSGDLGAFVRFLQAFVIPLLVPLLMPFVKILSTPKRAARVITKILADASGQTGVYYDEGGHPMRGSELVRDPVFQDRVVAETRAFLSASPTSTKSEAHAYV